MSDQDINYDPLDHYWIIATNPTQVFSTARGGYFATSDATYVAWAAIAGNVASNAATEAQVATEIAKSAKDYYAGSVGHGSQTFASDVTYDLTNPVPDLYFLSTTVGGTSFKMPAMNLPTSRPLGKSFEVWNNGSAFLNLCNNAGTTIAGVAAGMVVIVTPTGTGLTGVNGSFAPYYASTTIAEFSTDTGLGTSDTTVPTQKAIKTYVDAAPLGVIRTTPVTVDFHVGNNDTPIVLPPLPVGFTRYRVQLALLSGASADLSAATCGLFTAATGGGTAIVPAASAITVTSPAEDTNNNMQSFTVNNTGTQSHNQTTLYFRVGTGLVGAGTGKVVLAINPVS